LTKPERMSVYKHCVFHCSNSKSIHGSTPVQILIYLSITSQLGMIDIRATTKSKYYHHIVLLYLESRRCRYRPIIFFFYLYVSVVNFINYNYNYTYRLLFIALFDAFNLISICHCLCPSFYPYLSNWWS
jgi:hypothetical protein